MIAARIDIKSLQLADLESVARDLGQPHYRARQIVDWLYQKRATAFDEMTDLPREFRVRLAEQFGMIFPKEMRFGGGSVPWPT